MVLELTPHERLWLMHWLTYEAGSQWYSEETLERIDNLLAKLEQNEKHI